MNSITSIISELVRWFGSWVGFAHGLLDILNQVPDSELVWIFLFFPLAIYEILFLLFHRKFLLWLPSQSTLFMFGIFSFFIFFPLVVYFGVYLFMNIFDGWISLELLRQLLAGG